MNKIITISREFGSGGRELGKLLANELGYNYYDKEIISAVASEKNLNEDYVKKVLERGLTPVVTHHGISFGFKQNIENVELLVAEHNIIKALAKKDNCVIVGRGGNIVLKEHNPLSIFVYSDMVHKINRCIEYDKEKYLTNKEAEKKIKQINNARAKYYSMFSGEKWGNKEDYDLCINTSNIIIKNIVPVVVKYSEVYFGGRNV